ncbi:hypothetical protein BCR32DRAFT_282728 [Anaeromyces robustus]|uniref:Uncharacterized protein n=1 Tax=Anaeromyces robustus TaxID=1754192 RepID=A0A1Y1WWN7_9FUNG|nr:hypothetical protein BCR32DRAFT_282728 [Anaeromyces robustus]|eukprot:ORX77959.1 hypothetical protein BCR32DRAFT_282728 [Anaeromyces robustus]
MRSLVDILEDQYPSIWDNYNKIFSTGINSIYFLWTILVFIIISGNKSKNLVLYLIVFVFTFNYIGLLINANASIIFPKQYKEYGYEYSSNESYLWGHFLSRLFFYIGNIIGDWYLLIRTRSFVKSNRRIIWVFITCILYNMATLIKIYINFKYTPFKNNFDPVNDKLDYYTRKLEYKKNKWICDLFVQLASLCYDVAVLITLKRKVFINFNYDNIIKGKTKGNILILKFQRLSEYRIYLTILFSLFASPLILLFCFKLLRGLNLSNDINPKDKIKYIKDYCNDNEIEDIRRAFMNLTYILIFVDQIMLKYITTKNNNQPTDSRNYIINTYSNNDDDREINNNNNSSSRYKKYYNNKNYEDIENQSLISDNINNYINFNNNNKLMNEINNNKNYNNKISINFDNNGGNNYNNYYDNNHFIYKY